jgi:hypothetical protein
MKKIAKYFSVPLIIVLIHSNFSFAYTQIQCSMSKTQEKCECRNQCAKLPQFNTQESECCKVKFKEINNANILESNKIFSGKEVTFQFNDYFVKSDLNFNSSHNFKLSSSHFRPPPDIPILISHILI